MGSSLPKFHCNAGGLPLLLFGKIERDSAMPVARPKHRLCRTYMYRPFKKPTCLEVFMANFSHFSVAKTTFSWVGSRQVARQLCRELGEHSELGFEVEGFEVSMVLNMYRNGAQNGFSRNFLGGGFRYCLCSSHYLGKMNPF